MSPSDNAKNSVPANRGHPAGWIIVKFLLAVLTLGVMCVALVLTIGVAVGNAAEECPKGMHVGHLPCDVSIIICLIGLLIVGLGFWLLRWIIRMDATWRRLQPWFAREAKQRDSE